jgi:hypothetical protein
MGFEPKTFLRSQWSQIGSIPKSHIPWGTLPPLEMDHFTAAKKEQHYLPTFFQMIRNPSQF